MGNRRTAKVAEAIREVVSSTILLELRDPRVQNVTVIGVEVPIDLRTANIIVSVMGDETQQRLSMGGLDAARGFLQSKVADRVNLRFTPILSFELDDGVKKSLEASRILRELAEERATREIEEGESSETAAETNPLGASTERVSTERASAGGASTEENNLPEAISERTDDERTDDG